MPLSEVPRIQLNQDGTATFFVKIGGFEVGTPVEISCYASQANGATATFRWVEQMPEGDPEQGVIVVVKSVPVIAGTFAPADPITVVASAADVWITTLNQAAGNQLSPAIVAAMTLSGQVNPSASWNSDEKTYHSMYASTAMVSAWQPATSGPSPSSAPDSPK